MRSPVTLMTTFNDDAAHIVFVKLQPVDIIEGIKSSFPKIIIEGSFPLA